MSHQMEFFRRDPYAIALSCGTILFGVRVGATIGQKIPFEIRVTMVTIGLCCLKEAYRELKYFRARQQNDSVSVITEWAEESMIGIVTGLLFS